MKKFACFFLAMVMTLTMLSGCAGQEAKPAEKPASQSSAQNGAAQTGEKEKVVIAIWHKETIKIML